MSQEKHEKNIWTLVPHMEWLATIVILLGSIYSMNSRFDSFMFAWHEESKEFYGRLEKQDAEFKGKLALQDAEFKGKLALQDAEFKAHMMHFHNK